MLAVFPWLLTVVVVASATKHPGMALNTSNNTEYWRKRAKEACAVAVQMKDPHTKAVMLGIAQDYEKLTERAEQRAEKAH